MDKFKEILLKHCAENQVHLTSNEIETISQAVKEYVNELLEIFADEN